MRSGGKSHRFLSDLFLIPSYFSSHQSYKFTLNFWKSSQNVVSRMVSLTKRGAKPTIRQWKVDIRKFSLRCDQCFICITNIDNATFVISRKKLEDRISSKQTKIILFLYSTHHKMIGMFSFLWPNIMTDKLFIFLRLWRHEVTSRHVKSSTCPIWIKPTAIEV